MSTIAALNLAPTTNISQVFVCRGARNLQITISTAGVYLAFAYTSQGILQGFGIEEFHGLEVITINDEGIGAVQYRSAVPNTPATITIIATT